MSEALTAQEARQRGMRVNSRASVADVRLLGSSVDLQHFPDLERKLSWMLDIKPVGEVDDDADDFVVNCRFDLVVEEVGGDQNPTPVLKLTFNFGALFECEQPEDDRCSTDEINAFAASTGVLALYPYAREYINDVTSRLGMPRLTIGPYRIPVVVEPGADGEQERPIKSSTRSAAAKPVRRTRAKSAAASVLAEKQAQEVGQGEKAAPATRTKKPVSGKV